MMMDRLHAKSCGCALQARRWRITEESSVKALAAAMERHQGAIACG